MGTETSLFERIGGMDAVNSAVDIFYTKVLTDDSVSHFFENVHMGKQSGKLKSFLAYAFGAPLKYKGEKMKKAHAHMNITEYHFNTVTGHLIDTLRELNVAKENIDEVITITLSTKTDILGS